MNRKMIKVMSDIQDDIVDMILGCNDIDEMKTKLRSMVLTINILLFESKDK